MRHFRPSASERCSTRLLLIRVVHVKVLATCSAPINRYIKDALRLSECYQYWYYLQVGPIQFATLICRLIVSLLCQVIITASAGGVDLVDGHRPIRGMGGADFSLHNSCTSYRKRQVLGIRLP